MLERFIMESSFIEMHSFERQLFIMAEIQFHYIVLRDDVSESYSLHTFK